MNNNLKDHIKSMNPIEEIIGQIIPLRKAGKDFKASCPFHDERTPSFFVSPSRQTFHCFGCGASGDVIEFIMRWSKVSFKEALGILSGKAGGCLTRSDPPPKANRKTEIKPAPTSLPRTFQSLDRSGDFSRPLKYLMARDVTHLQIAIYGIGYIAVPGIYRDRIIFPTCVNGKVRGFVARAVGDAQPKYLYPRGMGKSSCFFGYDMASGFKNCVLVEGVFDVLRVGYDAIAMLGSSLSTEQVSLLYSAGFQRVTVMLDSDAFEKSVASCRQLESYFDVHLAIMHSGDPGGNNHKMLRELIRIAPKFNSDENIKEIINERIHS